MVMGTKKMMTAQLPETLKIANGLGPLHSDKMSIYGPSVGLELCTKRSQLGEILNGPNTESRESPNDMIIAPNGVTPKKKVTRKWKRSAKEEQLQTAFGEDFESTLAVVGS
ncbi:hypothetical protein Q3G72_002231 [Acer saccharum]|nr:hypothetical protein Q3G72_002231 [Acer saccharum]